MRSIAPLLMPAVFAGCMLQACSKSASGISGGGPGGTGSISVTPSHLNYFIDSCTVYIKYGTLDAPADGVYDDSQKCILPPGDTVPVAVFTGLRTGQYYFLGKGYHAGYIPPYVTGAASYTLGSESAVSIYLPTYSYWP